MTQRQDGKISKRQTELSNVYKRTQTYPHHHQLHKVETERLLLRLHSVPNHDPTTMQCSHYINNATLQPCSVHTTLTMLPYNHTTLTKDAAAECRHDMRMRPSVQLPSGTGSCSDSNWALTSVRLNNHLGLVCSWCLSVSGVWQWIRHNNGLQSDRQ